MNIAICDDIREHTEYIENQVRKIVPNADISSFVSVEDLYECVSEDDIDIVIIDIVLENENGIEVAKRIRQLHNDVIVIFVSGFADEYWEAVYEVEHIILIKKPIDEHLLKSALQKAEDKINENKKSVFMWRTKQGVIRIPYSDILYFESYKHDMKIVTNSAVNYITLSSVTLKNLERMLDKDIFIRCHQSFIVNAHKYSSVTRTSIKLGDVEVPISRKYIDTVREKINEGLRRELWD